MTTTRRSGSRSKATQGTTTTRGRRTRLDPARQRRAKTTTRTSRRVTSRPIGRRSSTFVILLVVVTALNFIGLVMVLSASSVTSLDETGSSWAHFQRQGIWFVLAMVAMVVMMRFDYRNLRRFSGPALAASVLLLVAVIVPGVGSSANGAQRWLRLGPLSVQPSEIAKLAIVLFVADLLAKRASKIRDPRLSVRPVIVLLALVSVLILRQPNLGTTLIIAATAFVIMFVAGAPLPSLATWSGLGVGAATVLALSADYRRARVLAFLDPWADPENTGYQTIQSLVGIANGGLWGVGLGNGRAKWGFLPFAHTDFIFAVIAEELGLIGALAIIAMFVIFALVGIKIAFDAPDRFGTLVAAGITTWLVVQAFINIGAVAGRLPITGVPLPFLSAGGSALLANMAAVGILMNIARQGRT